MENQHEPNIATKTPSSAKGPKKTGQPSSSASDRIRSATIRAFARALNAELPMSYQDAARLCHQYAIPYSTLAIAKRICTGIVIRTDGKDNVLKIFPV